MGDEENRKSKGIVMLGDANYDAWEQAVQDQFFACGSHAFVEASEHRPAVYAEAMKTHAKNHQAWVDEGKDGDEPEEPEKLYRATGMAVAKRQKAWGLITQSITSSLRAKVSKVKMGEVEDLIRAIGDQYFKATVGSRSKLKTKLGEAMLEDHVDLGAYVAYLEGIAKRLGGLGKPVDDEDRLYHLLRGLPDDYRIAKQAIKMPQNKDLTWEQIIFILEDVAEDPKIPGHSHKAGDSAHATQQDQVDACINFATKGVCAYGDKCKYEHIKAPGGHPRSNRDITCYNCGKKGHKRPECRAPKKASKDKAAAKAYAARQQATPLDDESYSDSDASFHVLDIAAATKAKKAMRGLPAKQGSTRWLLDGGSNCIVITDASQCFDIKPANILIKVGGGTLTCKQVGKTWQTFETKDGERTVLLKKARIMPRFGVNVMPEVFFLKKRCSIVKNLEHLDVTDYKGAAVLRANYCTASGLHFADSKTDDLLCNAGADHEDSAFSTNSEGNEKSPAFRDEGILQADYVPNPDFNISRKTQVPNKTSAESEKMQLSGDLSCWVQKKKMRPTTEWFRQQVNKARSKCYAVPSNANLQDLFMWHKRLGHRNFEDVARIVGISLPRKNFFCRSCVQGKSSRHSLTARQEPMHEAPRPGYLFHTDVKGPFSSPTKAGHSYLLVLIDDYSRMIFAEMLRTPSEFYEFFKRFCKRMEAEFGREGVVAQILSDGGRYYEKSAALQAFCRQKGIVQLFSPPYTQSLNGVAERTIRTVVEMGRTMLLHAGTPTYLYGYALTYAVYVLNRLPHRARAEATRRELWTGKKFKRGLSAIRTWGSASWVHKVHPTGPHADALSAKATLHIFLGVDDQGRGYRLARLPNYKIVHSAHVTFNESFFPCREGSHRNDDDDFDAGGPSPMEAASEAQSAAPQRPRRDWKPSEAALQHIAAGGPTPPVGSNTSTSTVTDDSTSDGGGGGTGSTDRSSSSSSDHDSSYGTGDVTGGADGKSSSSGSGPWLVDGGAGLHLCEDISMFLQQGPPVDSSCPQTHKQAMASPDPHGWRKAEISEFNSHVKNETFGPEQDLPDGFTAVIAGKVKIVKRDGRKKDRLVIMGNRMQSGRDYNQTFAPVPHLTTLRVLFALAAKFDWVIDQGDVSTAFLASDMDTELYVQLPAGFNADPSIEVQSRPRKVRRMLKGVPGIPQGSRLWNQRSHKIFVAAGLERCKHDYGLYCLPAMRFYLAAWVDDHYLFYDASDGSTRAEAERIKKHIQNEMDLPEWKPVFDCIGVMVRRDRAARTIVLCQSEAIGKLLVKARFDTSKPVDTPVAAGFVFTKNDCVVPSNKAEEELATWYRSILASCIYIYSWTHPEIGFAISKLSKFMQNPGAPHVTALKRLLRYLAGSKDKGLVYSFGRTVPRQGVYGYYDASHADDHDTLRTTMSYIFFYEGCTISWHTKMHTFITTSTNHSEYCAAAKCAREAKSLKTIFASLGFERKTPIVLFSDSQGAIAMNYNPVKRSASKHVDLADHYAREQVERGVVAISYVSTKMMIADVLTKALGKTDFNRLTQSMVGSTALR